jgi:hypothetical protein
MSRDREHLRLLSIFHYVVAALTACTSLLFLLHIGGGLLLATGAVDTRDPDARFVGLLLIAVGVFVMGLFLACAAVTAYAGHCLAAHKNYTYCLVIAAILCLNAPIGTVLGVFTIIVLMRSSVRELFGKPSFDG